MSMSRFRLAPKVGHIERMKRIYGYLSRTKHYALRFRTEEPNYIHLPELEYDWTRNYGNVLEEIPKDTPEPPGKSVTTTTFFDANLLHDLITGSLLLLYCTSSTYWRLVFQETSNCRKCNLWIRVCCCQDCH